MLEKYSSALVTGGLGFVGRHLVQVLLSQGKNVTVLDSGTTAYQTAAPTGATVVRADIREAKQLVSVLQHIDIVFHLAANANGSVSVLDPRFDFETNAVGTFNMLEAATAANVKRFYYMSSASVYGVPQYTPMDELHPTRPIVPYGATKLAGELLALSFWRSKGLPVVAGRPFCIYGPGENPKLALVEVSRYLRWHLNDKPMQIIGDAHKKTRDFVFVADAVAGILAIAGNGNLGEVYNIGSGTELSMFDLANMIGTVTGKSAEIQEIKTVTDDTYRLTASIEKLESLGYAPKTSLEDGLRQVAAYLGASPELPEGATIFDSRQSGEAA